MRDGASAPRVLTDADLPRLGRAGAADAMRAYLQSVANGTADAPPRVVAEAGGRRHVFTVGADLARDVAGFRFYSTGPAYPADGRTSQALVLVRASTGEVQAVATGDAFGAWRTAALGAVAMVEATRHLARPLRVAVIGAGFQAGHHTRTWAAARPVARFAVWARRPDATAAFAAELAADVGVPADASATAADACRDADAVLCVTNAREPVLSDDDVPADAYVATVGPKFGGAHELPAKTYARAAALVSDAPGQVARYEADRGPLPGARRADEVVSLADVVAGRATLPTSGVRLFVSEGLAGSEVALLDALADA